MNLDLILGARPNFVKAANVYNQLSLLDKLDISIIHTGQHYDYLMKDIIISDLKLPKPKINLNGRGSIKSSLIASIMVQYTNYLNDRTPDLIMVFGDVDSTLACSLVASRKNIPIVHIESGLRSFDRTMPEEINRILTDQLSDYLFTTSPEAKENLLNEGKSENQIYFVGNTMIDSLYTLNNEFNNSKIMNTLGIDDKFALITIHRPSNVDNTENINFLVESLIDLSKIIKCIFPVHPRTKNVFDKLFITQNLNSEKNILLINPLGYIDFMSLQKRASVVITDSGGVQEESTYFGVPCLTVRNSTERPITLSFGTNKIIGTSYNNIVDEVKLVLSKPIANKIKIPQLWDGKASRRIKKIFKSNFNL
jgi:UDP-N-acetylglucosamine 2-epimerase (non-hydrolysing)